jgi:hypothetical protein
MPTDKKRIMLTADDTTLDTLARDATAPGVSLAVREYARLLATASREVESQFTRTEWNLMADALNGCLELHDLSGGITYGTMLLAEIGDSHGLNRLGDKWLGVKGKKADDAVADLLRRIESLAPIHHAAIAASVRWFWDHSTTLRIVSGNLADPATDEWWRVGFRRKRADSGM